MKQANSPWTMGPRLSFLDEHPNHFATVMVALDLSSNHSQELQSFVGSQFSWLRKELFPCQSVV